MLLEHVLGLAGLRSPPPSSPSAARPGLPDRERPNPEEPAALERLLAAARRGRRRARPRTRPRCRPARGGRPRTGVGPHHALAGAHRRRGRSAARLVPVGARHRHRPVGLLDDRVLTARGSDLRRPGGPPRGDPDRLQVARTAGARPTGPDPGALLRGGDRLRRRRGRPRQGRRHRRGGGVRPGLGAQRARSRRARRARRPRPHPWCVRDPQRRRPPHGHHGVDRRPARRWDRSGGRPGGPRTDRRPVSSGGGWTTAPGSSVDAREPSRG